MPSQFNLWILGHLCRNQLEPITPLINKPQMLEYGRNNFIASVTLATLHGGKIDGWRQKPRACYFYHIIVDGNLDILTSKGVIAMHDCIAQGFTNCFDGVFPTINGINPFDHSTLIDVAQNKFIRLFGLLNNIAVNALSVDKDIGARAFKAGTFYLGERK